MVVNMGVMHSAGRERCAHLWGYGKRGLRERVVYGKANTHAGLGCDSSWPTWRWMCHAQV